jgi:hypothetical protein
MEASSSADDHSSSSSRFALRKIKVLLNMIEN